jgi:hypothetical protein
MTTTPVIALQGMQALAAGLGGYCLILWFQKSRKQMIIAFHLLAGLGGIEALIGFMHMSDLDADSPVRALGMTAAKWFGLAVFTGFAAPLIGKKSPPLANLSLAVHVGSALLGFFTTLSFASQV